MLRKNGEFWLALLTAILITTIYALVIYWTKATPAAGSLVWASAGNHWFHPDGDDRSAVFLPQTQPEGALG